MDPVSLLPLIAIFALFWLLIIRPASKRQKDMARMQGSLEIGYRVVLTSGIHGTVAALDDATVDVELAPGVVVTVSRPAVGSIVLDPIDEDADDAYDELDHDGVEPADEPQATSPTHTEKDR